MAIKRFSRPLGEAMADAFNTAEGELRDMAQGVNQVANILASGGLLGLTGDEFYNALAQTLYKVVDDLADKMDELKGDVEDARRRYDEAEARAKAQFEQGL
ncbi:MAG: hypothetical protein AAF633_15730 [Chloroflexota bacterium]